MRPLRVTILATLALLAGCGKMAPLQPPPGKPMPVKPLMARTTPTVEQLLTTPIYARPNRVDELVKRSEARKPDPFDLPPPVGSAAPAQPAGTDPQPVSNETGPATPQ
jgi:predicted small lipoprotein YifL